MIWNDEQGYHFIVGGIHWIAQYKIERPDWTPEQERAAMLYLMAGYFVVTLFIILYIVFVWWVLQ